MKAHCELFKLLILDVTLLEELVKEVTRLRSRHQVQHSLTAREDVIDQALELLIVNLVELELPRDELLNEVPVQEGEAVVDYMSIEGEGIPFFSVAIVDCEELRINFESNFLVIHKAELLVNLILPLQTF
jgi:hypothetical protein